MLRTFLVLVLLIASFTGGLFYERYSSGEIGKLTNELDLARMEAAKAKSRQDQINETLQLVKRQIQADRVAYQALQQTVDESEKERALLKEKVEVQQKLLKKLKQKLE